MAAGLSPFMQHSHADMRLLRRTLKAVWDGIHQDCRQGFEALPVHFVHPRVDTIAKRRNRRLATEFVSIGDELRRVVDEARRDGRVFTPGKIATFLVAMTGHRAPATISKYAVRLDLLCAMATDGTGPGVDFRLFLPRTCP